MTIDTWGINLSTVPGDAGITLGRRRRVYYFAGPASAGPSVDVADVFRNQGADGDAPLRLEPSGPFSWHGLTPLALRGRSEGVSLGAGPTGSGATAGVHAFAVVRLAADSNVLLHLKTRGGRPFDDVFHVKEFKR